MYCRRCGYVLDGRPENRCPECGTGFDPTDPGTYRSAHKRRKRRPNFLQIAISACILIVWSFVVRLCPESAAWIVMWVSLVVIGIVAGARAGHPIMQAVCAGALGYLVLLVHSLYQVGWNPPADADTPCIPLGGLILVCMLCALGGAVASVLLPKRPEKSNRQSPSTES